MPFCWFCHEVAHYSKKGKVGDNRVYESLMSLTTHAPKMASDSTDVSNVEP